MKFFTYLSGKGVSDLRNWKVFTATDIYYQKGGEATMKEISKQDPNFRAKVQDYQRLNSVRIDLALQVYKALTVLIKSADYKLASCSLLDKMDSDYSSPSKEFRFLFVKEIDETENPD